MTESNGDGASRRTVLMGVGAAGAAGLLAACGGSEPAAAPNAPAPGGTEMSNATGSGQTTAAGNRIKVADIPVGGGKIFPDRNLVVTQPTAGAFKAFDTTCPHQGCQVAEVSGGRITCPCHGSQFFITDGSVAKNPNTGQFLARGLRAKTATVTDDTITVG